MDRVLVVGGGLAGLIAARTLYRCGIAFDLIEARDRLGGRILSVEGFDLGPSWFWPEMQPKFAAFLQELGVGAFAQADTGDQMLQRGPGPAARYPGIRQAPASMRAVGGMAAVIAALAADLPMTAVRRNTRVCVLRLTPGGAEVTMDGGDRLAASHVLLAAPPRLLEAEVTFDPPLPPDTLRLWRATPTWMAPHAKFVAVYARAFWRDAGLSGVVRSQVGPLVEVHDATTADGRAALFGFVGVPASARARAGEAAVVAAALRQLGNLFGPEATQPLATHYKDWAADPLTATPADQDAGGHPQPPDRPWVEGDWAERLTLIGAETSVTEPGYLAGAHETALRGVAQLMARRAAQPA